jgi:glycosyltransferase involved in cell wall biosynthesis
MNIGPKLTIITVCFNDLDNLKKTVNSLREQDNQNFEHLVVDGCSDDGTIEYLNSLQVNYKFKFISEKDSGIYDAMNKGVELADGDFLWFLNAGDTAYSYDVVSKIITNVRSDIGLLLAKVKYISDDVYVEVGKKKLTRRDFFMSAAVCHQGVVFNKKFLPTPAYNLKYSIVADSDLIWKLVFNYHVNYSSFDWGIANFMLGGFNEQYPIKRMFEYLKINLKHKVSSPVIIFIFFGYSFTRYLGVKILKCLGLHSKYRQLKNRLKCMIGHK